MFGNVDFISASVAVPKADIPYASVFIGDVDKNDLCQPLVRSDLSYVVQTSPNVGHRDEEILRVLPTLLIRRAWLLETRTMCPVCCVSCAWLQGLPTQSWHC